MHQSIQLAGKAVLRSNMQSRRMLRTAFRHACSFPHSITSKISGAEHGSNQTAKIIYNDGHWKDSCYRIIAAAVAAGAGLISRASLDPKSESDTRSEKSPALTPPFTSPLPSSHAFPAGGPPIPSIAAALGATGNVTDAIERAYPAVCRLEAIAGYDNRVVGGGSGFVVREDGIIVSNYHVFAGMAAVGGREVRATFDDGRTYMVTLLAFDDQSDIAIAKIITNSHKAAPKFPTISFGHSMEMRRGDLVVVIGAALGGTIVPGVGVLSGTRYVADDHTMMEIMSSRPEWNLLQVDAAMSSGNSGGPVINEKGEVIGVAVMVQTSLPGGVGFANFAIAADQAAPIVEALLNSGRVDRPSIGLVVYPVNRLDDERDRRDSGTPLLPDDGDYVTGLLVVHAPKESPGYVGGLRMGDVILDIDGRRMRRVGDLFAAMGPVYDPSKQLTCTVFRPDNTRRSGSLVTITVAPGKKDAPEPRQRRPLLLW